MNINKNFKYVFISNIANRLLSSLVFYLLSVYFEKSVFGDFIWCFTIVNYFAMLADLGLDLVGIRQFSESNGNENIVNNIFSTKLLLSLLSFIGCFAFVFLFPFTEIQKKIIFLFSLQILLLPFQFLWYYSAIMNFKIQAYTSLIQNSTYLLLVYVFGYLKLSEYIPLTYTLSFIVPSILLYAGFKKSYPSFSFLIIGFKKTIIESLALGSSRIFTAMYASFDILFIGLLLTPAQVGDYSVAFKIASVFLIPCISLSGIFLPKIISSINENFEYNKNRVDFIDSMIIFSTLTSLFLIFNSDLILQLLYGNKYNNSIFLLTILAGRVFFVHFSYSFSNICIALNRDKKILFNTIFTLLFNVISSFIFIKHFNVRGAAYSSIATEVFCMLLYYISITSDFRNGRWFSLSKHFFISLGILIVISIIINNLAIIPLGKLIINTFTFMIFLIFLRFKNIFNILKFV